MTAKFVMPSDKSIFIKKDAEGRIVPCNNKGEIISGVTACAIHQEMDQVISLTISVHCAGWKE